MSMERNIYVGVYLKVWMPFEKYTDGEKECLTCRIRSRDTFCSKCGYRPSPIQKERMKELWSLLLEVFGDENRFSHVRPESGNYILVIANMKSQPHLLVEDELEYELPENSWDGDWQTLATALTEKQIEFKRKFGIVNYWH